MIIKRVGASQFICEVGISNKHEKTSKRKLLVNADSVFIAKYNVNVMLQKFKQLTREEYYRVMQEQDEMLKPFLKSAHKV